MRKDWSAIGWQGVSTILPSDWNLVAVSGDRTKGYFRADGPGNSAFETRWVSIAKPPDIESRLDKFLEDLKKAAKKRKIKFSSNIKNRKPTQCELRSGGSSLAFSWQSDRSALGRILWCAECKRLVIAQIVGPLDTDHSSIAGEILNSICSHEEQGWNVWGLYGFKLPIPDSFRLIKQQLMSSYVRLTFRGKEGELTVERWGLAESLIKDKGLEAWYNYEYRPENSGFAMRIQTSKHNGHEMIELQGSRKLLGRITMAPKILFGKGQPNNLSAKVWFCGESNRIHSLRLLHSGHYSIINEIAKRIECH